jgi:membrane protease YdiL (CAAX protease family)
VTTQLERLGPPPVERRTNVVGRFPLTCYFVIAFAGSWLVWLPWNLAQNSWGLLPYRLEVDSLVIIAISTFTGPMLAALVVTAAAQGKAGVVRFLKRFLLWRVGWRWWAIAVLGLPVLATAGALLTPGVAASYTPVEDPWMMLGSAVVFFFWPALVIGGPLGEEPGWRGFAQPRMSDRFGPLPGTLLLGVIWGVWHATIWTSGEWTTPTWQNMVMFTVWITAVSVVYAWIYHHTQGSILIAIVVHSAMDAFPNAVLFPMFPALGTMTDAGILTAYLANTIAYGIAAIVIIIATKGRLGLPRGQSAPG